MLVGVLVIWGVFAWLDHYTCHGCAITVPDLRGFTVDLVEDITTKKDLRFILLDSIYDSKSEPGAVVDQDPEPGAQVKENRRIYIIINKMERESVAMEDVTNVSPRSAMATLRAMGLEVGTLIPRPSPHNDLVFEQQYKGEIIEPGTMIKKGEKIDLVVAGGSSGEKTMVPILIGFNLRDAGTILREHSLNLGAPIFSACKNCETADDSTTMSIVYKQRPIHSGESWVELGSYIDVWLTTDSVKVPKKINTGTPDKKDDI